MFHHSLSPVEETYSDVKKLVGDQVSKFTRRYKTDWDETCQAAGLGYAKAYQSYDPERAAFNTWVVEKVWNAMLDQLRKECLQTKRRRLRDPDVDPDAVWREGKTFDLFEFLEDLSEDAKTVVFLATEIPPPLKKILADRENTNPRTVKAAVKKLLLDAGWTASRVTESFSEIRSALS
jgi:RNA polymerase sigma factor (sigma-70 family)